jgi:dipeptidyl aminopeptidase/acylaminoacyl peptidase
MFRKIVGCLTLLLIATIAFSALATIGEMGIVQQFAISPSGERVLFISKAENSETRRAEVNIMLLDLTSTNIIGLTGQVREAAPSPNGNFIAYVEHDAYYGSHLLLLAADGSELKLRYHQPRQQLSRLRWSSDSKYLSFISDGVDFRNRRVVISPQLAVVPEELEKVKWQEPKQLHPDHPIYQKKPTILPECSVVWNYDNVIYVQAVDGIWKGILDVPFMIQWTQIVFAENLKIPQSLCISPAGTHLMYERVSTQRGLSDIWVLSLYDVAVPMKIGEGTRAQFTPDDQCVLLVNLGLWVVSLDDSSRRKLTNQISLP